MQRGNILFCALIVFAATIQLCAQEAKTFNPTAVPSTGANSQAFVPRGWKIDTHVEGDLNGDSVADTVMELVPADYNSSGVTEAPAAHALLILLSTPDRKLKRAGVSTKLLVPDAPQYSVELSIKNGVLVVHQNFGFTQVSDKTHRFRLDPASGRFLLIGFDDFPYHRPQGPEWPVEKTSDNYLTGVRIITSDHWLKNGENKPTEKRETIQRKLVRFEDVDESDDAGVYP